VWRAASHPQSPPLGAYGGFPSAFRVFSDAELAAGLRAVSVLRWCSPQSSAPRHTVGSHAKAAKYEMGRLRGPREPTVWKCPGLPGQLPHRSRLTFSHIPTDRCAVGRTGAGADGPAVDSRQTHFWCVWLKIDSRAAKVNLESPPFRTRSGFFFFPATPLRTQTRAPLHPLQRGDPSHLGSHRPGSRPGSRPGLPPLIYPPTDAQRVARARGQMGRRSIPDKPTLGAFG
jgi:hypothetical protein